MNVLNRLLKNPATVTVYDRFEKAILGFFVVLISLIILYSTVLAVAEIWGDLKVGSSFLEAEVLQDTFGSLLTILILMEFNHSIVLSMRTRSGAIQVRIVVLIAILAIARKLILLDYKSAHLELLLGLGGISLALGLVYWLLADGDRRRHHRAPSASDQGEERQNH